MKYFLDTEFIEGFHKPLFGKRRHFIDLVSIGIVAEDGREYYAISNEFNPNDADEWVKENVLEKINQQALNHPESINVFSAAYVKPNKEIAQEIIEFIGSDTPEFYGYYADYDWVLFCSLFGTMMQLPKGFPMYCRDLKQTVDEWATKHAASIAAISDKGAFDLALQELKQHPDYPKQTNEHNALADAKWNFELYKFITT